MATYEVEVRAQAVHYYYTNISVKAKNEEEAIAMAVDLVETDDDIDWMPDYEENIEVIRDTKHKFMLLDEEK